MEWGQGMCVMGVWGRGVAMNVFGGRRGRSGSLMLELEAAVNCFTRVLETKVGSSERAESTANC